VTRILLVDDHALVRQGLKQILREALPNLVFGDAASGPEALERAQAKDWDVVILDISLPNERGLGVLKELRRRHPRRPVLVLGMYSEEQFAVRALRAGAAGYVTKRTAHEEIIGAILKVLGGGRYVSASLAERLAEEIDTGSKAPHERLTDREFEVFTMLSHAKTVKQISQELSLSPQTVSTHRSRLLEKMGFTTNNELTEYAIQNGLLK